MDSLTVMVRDLNVPLSVRHSISRQKTNEENKGLEPHYTQTRPNI